MSNFRVICLLLVFFCIFHLNNAADIRYFFKGSAGCTNAQATPCNFDDPEIWTVTVLTKRGAQEILDEPSSPALQSKPYDIVIPATYSEFDYVLETQNTTGYNIDRITIENGLGRSVSDVSSTQAISNGTKIIFKNTKLLNFGCYQIGSPSTSHKLIFENTEINSSGCDFHSFGNSIVHFKGTTYASFTYPTFLRVNDVYIVDPTATLEAFDGSFVGASLENGYQSMYIYGTVILQEYWEINIQSSDRQFSKMFLTGANITTKGDTTWSYLDMPIFIGETAADNGKVTYWEGPLDYEFANITISEKTKAYLQLFYTYSSIISVDDESELYVTSSESYPVFYNTPLTQFIVQGKSSAFFDSKVNITSGLEKREIQHTLIQPEYTNFTVYDGLIQFNNLVVVREYVYFKTKSPSSVLTFNGMLDCSTLAANYEFVAGSTISFNNIVEACTNELPTDGVNYEFGAHAYSPSDLPISGVSNNGSIKLKGSTIQFLSGYNISIEDSTFGGYGNVDLDVTLSKTTGTPKFALSSIGETLLINRKLTIPTGSIISITADSNSCGNLVVGTLDISSGVSILLDFVGAPPTQNKTYIVVVEYTTFTGTLPQSPDEQVYQVENDTQNKQIKVHYIYTPPPPTEPTIPNGPNSPNQTPTDLPPTNSQPPTPATANSISPMIVLTVLVVAILSALFM